MKNPFRKVFLCGAAALMLAAPAYGLGDVPIIVEIEEAALLASSL
jgi:hypothetical protein